VHWVDQNLPAGAVDPGDNDRARVILNVASTADVEALERILRTVWGGSLCVSRGVRTDAELDRIQCAVQGSSGWVGSSRDGRRGCVDLYVVRALRQFQTQLDATHGAVNLVGALTPQDLPRYQH